MKQLITILIVTIVSILNANTGLVSGTVNGASEPLAGANIFLQGTSIGTTTDSIGNYIVTSVFETGYIASALSNPSMHSLSLLTIRIPLPPPPALAFSITG